MLLVKKRLWDQNILLLPLILSLLRLFPDLYFGLPRSAVLDNYNQNSILTQGSNRFGRRNIFSDEPVNLSPKSLEYLFQQHQNDILNDLTSLGQFSDRHRRVIEAYVLRLVENPFRLENFSVPSTSGPCQRPCEQARENRPLQRSLSSASDLSSADAADLNIFDLNINDDDLYPLEYQLGDKSLLDEAIGLSMSMEEPFTPLPPPLDTGLTEEDVDLIEILWKQDIDLGVDKSIFQPVPPGEVGGDLTADKFKSKPEDDGKKHDEKNKEPKEDDPWAGLNYIIDSETGEHLLVEDPQDPPAEAESSDDELPALVLERLKDIEDDLIGEDLGIDLLELATGSDERRKPARKESEGEASTSGVSDVSSVSEGELERADELTDALEASLDSMLEGGMHHRSYPVRVPLVRGVNADQRWQELAHLFTLPSADHHTSGHYHYPGYQGIAVPHAVYPNLANLHHDQRSALLHNASLAAPPLSVAELQGNGTYPSVPQTAGNASHLSSAVAVSLNLTSNGTADHTPGSNPTPTGVPAFKMEVTPDPGYYQPGVEMGNGHQEGFFSSLLNDDDLQMMDVGMPEGAYGVRMIDANSNLQGGAHGVADTRQGPVPGGEAPLIRPGEGDWSEHHYLGYSSALRNTSNGSIGSLGGSESRNPPQKKHQFYGKRFAQDNSSGENAYFGGNLDPAVDPLMLTSDVKYPYPEYPGHTIDIRGNALDALHHNHSYSMNRSQEDLAYRPVSRDKRATSSAMSSRSSTDGEGEQMSRDEKRARALNIPISVEDIINLPMDEFNERLAKYDLSETQLSLIRDIRRRGKNKVAAQNCRKRKLDQILGLADEVRRVKERKIRLLREREMLLAEKSRIKERFAMLHRHVFQSLRDPDGNPYSPYEYSLQQSADGSVVLVPRTGIRAEQELGEPGPSSVIRKSGDSGRNASA